MSVYASSSLRLLVVVTMLVFKANGEGWQGSGNMNNTVLTKIWTQIDANYSRDEANGGLGQMAVRISQSLNQEWATAWNVVTAIGKKQYDTIVYGYAFNDHWMWYNGMPSPQSTNIVSFLIWKDYNCNEWALSTSLESSGFTNEQKSTIVLEANKLTESELINDIWGAAHEFMGSLIQQAGFDSASNAYSIIMSQSGQSYFQAYLCRVSRNLYSSRKEIGDTLVSGKFIGSFYLFQTRSAS